MAGRAWIGTSGWNYQHWRGVFYPHGLPERDWLRHYAGFFPTVEINASFYRLPTPETFARWRADTPEGFRFAVKASRLITHLHRLHNVDEAWATFLSHARGLGQKLACVLVQLPPSMPVNLPRLEAFMRLLPVGLRVAFEFRHPSWFQRAVYDALSRRDCALCQASSPGHPGPDVRTAGFSYLRMHGGPSLDESSYSPDELARYGDRLREEMAQGRDSYVYFNNDPRGYAVANARDLNALVLPEPVKETP